MARLEKENAEYKKELRLFKNFMQEKEFSSYSQTHSVSLETMTQIAALLDLDANADKMSIRVREGEEGSGETSLDFEGFKAQHDEWRREEEVDSQFLYGQKAGEQGEWGQELWIAG